MSVNQLRECLKKRNLDGAAKALLNIHEKYGDDWIRVIKLSDVLPDPISINFNGNMHSDFLRAVTKLIEVKDAKQAEDIYNEATDYSQSILYLANYFSRIEVTLSNNAFFASSLNNQIRKLCLMFENQAQILQKMNIERSQQVVGDRSFLPLSPCLPTFGEAMTSIVDSFEALGDSLDIILRFAHWKAKTKLDKAETIEYSDEEFSDCMFILQLGTLRNSVEHLWQNVKYQNWKHRSEDHTIIYLPPIMEKFILESASVLRYQSYGYELVMHHLALPELSASIKLFNEIIDSIKADIQKTAKDHLWLNRISVEKLTNALRIHSIFEIYTYELLFRFYKADFRKIIYGDESNGFINGERLLITAKFIFLLATIYKSSYSEKFDYSDVSTYDLLIPKLDLDKTATLLSKVTGCKMADARKAMQFLVFNRDHKKLDIWCQPLVPISKTECILLPSIATTMNIGRIFEHHLGQWDLGFDDRGPVFEDDIRQMLRSNGIDVASKPIKLMANDHKQLEYDVMAVFNDYLLIIEAKCLRNPYSPSDRFRAWREIRKGINQLCRGRKLLNSHWDQIKRVADINLPQLPINEKRVLCMIVTNIFTFTGYEVDGIRITDNVCFERFLISPSVDAYEISGQEGVTNKMEIIKLWKNEKPTPTELWEYIKNPIGVRRITENMFIEYQSLPKSMNDEELIIFPYPQFNITNDNRYGLPPSLIK